MTPRLPALSAKMVMSILEKHGFVLDHITGSHHIFYRTSDKKTVTVPLHRTLAKGTLLAILKQAGLSRYDIEKQ